MSTEKKKKIIKKKNSECETYFGCCSAINKAVSECDTTGSIPEIPGEPPILIASLPQSVAAELQASSNEQLDQGCHSEQPVTGSD